MEWYYAGSNGRNGPVTDEAFAQLVHSGAIADSTLVWNVTMPEWAAFGSLRSGGAPAAIPPILPASPAAPSVYCSHCGRAVASEADLVTISGRPVCGVCKPALMQQMREGATPWVRSVNYAGFWIRFAAVMIDSVILSVINVVFSFALLGWAAATKDPSYTIAAAILTYAAGLAVGIAYEGWFLVNKGATPGKLAFGLRVIRPLGGPITWGTAIGRYFGKMVSGMILGIGFLMAAWDDEKRALHDRMVNTRVVRT